MSRTTIANLDCASFNVFVFDVLKIRRLAPRDLPFQPSLIHISAAAMYDGKETHV